MRKLVPALIAAAFCVATAQAQAPYLVTDLNTSFTPNAASSSPRAFAGVGSIVFFAATNDIAGIELFTTDGTTVQLVRDISVGSTSSSPSAIVPLDSTTVVFSAADSANGRELWRSDGTEAGTVLVKDIAVGGVGSNAAPVAAMAGRVFLLASDSGNQRDVWVTDGTESGTVKLMTAPEARGYFVINGFMYFFTATTLYKSDGTPGGTTVVRNDLNILAMIRAGDRLFFAGWDSAHGYELWSSDGTPAGTMLLKDISPGAGSSFSSSAGVSMAAVGSNAVFFAYDPTNGWALWRSDGTPNGTSPFKSYPTWSTSAVPPTLTSAGGLVYFSDSGLWRTDGSLNGTIKLGSVTSPVAYVETPSRVFFFALANGQVRLCSTDGSDGDTVVVSQAVIRGTNTAIAYAAGKIYFSGSDGATGSEPWVSDGTEGGTHLIENLTADPPGSSNPDLLRGATNGSVYFTATSGAATEIYVSDGTVAGTKALTSFSGQKTLGLLDTWKTNLFFTTTSPAYGLYFSDGTVSGTTLLKNSAGAFGSTFASSRYFYFTTSRDPYSYAPDLWRTDGTEAGTVNITTAMVSGPRSATRFAEADGYVYFEAAEPRGFWRTDGTPDSTVLLFTHPDYYASASAGPVVTGGYLYYGLTTNLYGEELWRFDTHRLVNSVIDINPGSLSSSPNQLVAAGPLVFFTADDGSHGREVWRSDGTRAGTFMLRDVIPGSKTSSARSLTAVGNRVFWVANDGLDGYELWTSDGTTAGTVMVADIAPGAASSSPDALAAADGLLFFSADDGVSGRELWQSDGTAAGTIRTGDLYPGAAGSDPRRTTVAGRRLFFSAQTTAGRELWAMALNATAYTISDARVVEGNSGTSLLRFTVTRTGDLSQATSVVFTTSEGTATAGADYTAASGTVAFASGSSAASIDINVTGDTAAEADETLYVTLSSPSAGVLQNVTATGTIEDDDRAAALSVQVIQQAVYYSRIFVVTNSGPSDANGVVLRVTESPSVATLTGSGCAMDGYGAVVCSLGPLAVGESRTITLGRSTESSLGYDSNQPPGYTVTAAVSSSTGDPDLTDNSIVNMISRGGGMLLPPFLTSSTTARLEYETEYTSSYYDQTYALTSSNPGVVINPTSAVIRAGERHASFNLQVGNVTGTTKLSVGGESMVVPIVAAGSTPKLDVIFVMTAPYNVQYPGNVQFTARVAGRMANGTYPTGNVQLLGNENNVLDEQALDAKGRVTFVRSGLPPGSYRYSVRYSGDPQFNPLTAALPSVSVLPYSTSLSFSAPPFTCSTSVDVVVTITTTDTTEAPTGTITITGGAQGAQGTLAPTGINGVSQATISVPVSSATTYLTAAYNPVGPFNSGYGYSRTVSVGCLGSITLVATATASDRVVLNWTPTGAATYDVIRLSPGGGSWTFLGYAGAATFLDTTVVAGRAYLYRVRPTGTATYSAPDLATTVIFADDPVVPRVTEVKAAHFTELLTAANAVRSLAGLTSAAFDSIPVRGGTIIPAPVNRLRLAISDARRYLGMTALGFGDPTLSAGNTLIKAAHVQELRDGVK